MRALGWRPTLNIPQALAKTVGWLRENEWVFEKRDGKPLQRPSDTKEFAREFIAKHDGLFKRLAS